MSNTNDEGGAGGAGGGDSHENSTPQPTIVLRSETIDQFAAALAQFGTTMKETQESNKKYV